jgi:hypothetical protein
MEDNGCQWMPSPGYQTVFLGEEGCVKHKGLPEIGHWNNGPPFMGNGAKATVTKG